MSFCRFSSDDFKSDIYVYEAYGNIYRVHIAASRRIYNKPLPPKHDGMTPTEFQNRYIKVLNMLDDFPSENIEHPLAGETRAFENPMECAKFLQQLKNEGFYIPDGVIESLEEEDFQIKEANSKIKGL